MATCSLILDKRIKLKNDLFNLSIRIISGKQQMYLNISKMTEKQHSNIFDKKNMGEKPVEFRRNCQEQLTKVEQILSEMKVFDRSILKAKFYGPNLNEKRIDDSLKLSNLFTRYIEENNHLSFRTKKHMSYSKNVFIKDDNEILITNITKEFLSNNEKKRLSEGTTISSINSNLRDLRTVINYFINKKNIIPTDFVYPFSKNEYQIIEYIPKKLVLSNEEIQKVVNTTEFINENEEFSKNIWELLYRCNGINFADLLRLRWDQQKGDYFIFFRKKTENTRKNLKQEVVLAINEKIQNLLDKVGKKESSFVLGLLSDSYTEENFDYMNRKMRKSINKSLESFSDRLNLSIPLKLKTSRDSYASVLKRSGVSIDKISEMLSHSNTKVTKHYLGSMDLDMVREINENLI